MLITIEDPEEADVAAKNATEESDGSQVTEDID